MEHNSGGKMVMMNLSQKKILLNGKSNITFQKIFWNGIESIKCYSNCGSLKIKK